MKKIRLYNSDTDKKRRLFAAIVHAIFQSQYQGYAILEVESPDPREIKNHLEGTEHVTLLGDIELAYFRTYLAVSTSPETGIFRRLNRIQSIPALLGKSRLSRVVLALATECPRGCLRKVDETSEFLGEKGIQFELWEAKDVRQQIAAHFNVQCPSFDYSHMVQLSRMIDLSCHLIQEPLQRAASPESDGGNSNRGVNSSDLEDDLSAGDRSSSLGTLFVSYASEDREFVDRLVSMLDRYATRVWYDRREILVGDSIVESVGKAINQASALVAVLSTASVKKPWVLRELNAGIGLQLQRAGVAIFPILIEPCDVPSLLADIKYADFTRSFELGFNELIAGIQGRRAAI